MKRLEAIKSYQIYQDLSSSLFCVPGFEIIKCLQGVHALVSKCQSSEQICFARFVSVFPS